jgi:hypothetical protein
MAQNAALRGGQASGNVLLERFELSHRLPQARLVQLDLDLLVLLVHCRVVLPLNYPNAPLLILGDKRLASDLGLEKIEVLQPWYLEVFPGRVVERSIAEERDVITALAVVLTLEVIVFAFVRREDDVASSDEGWGRKSRRTRGA